MATHAVNTDTSPRDRELYQILRHLFHTACRGSQYDSQDGNDWEFYGSGTYPGETIITEYQSKSTGDRIKAQAFLFVNGEATKHLFTFTPNEPDQE